MHAEIAGAGFAGLTAAIALRRRGWTVRVHEKDPELRAFGAGIYIWENGLRVLHAIGACEGVLRGAHQAPAYETRRDGKTVSFQPVNGNHPYRVLTMTRQHLYAPILAAARREGVEILTSSEAVAAEPDGVLCLADGRRFDADLVIAADGVRSPTRDSLGLPVVRRRYQDGITRVLVERSGLVGGAWDHVIDFWAFTPRTLRILYTPCEDDLLYFAMMAPLEDTAATALPLDPAIWTECFPTLAPAIAAIGTRGRYDVYETTRLERWSVGRVAIVGDSAHAMPPTLAQGAGCAMMNALSLAEIVTGAPDIPDALRRWEAQERALTDHTQARAAELAHTRELGSGMKWDDVGLRAAHHIPTGSDPDGFATIDHAREQRP